MHLVVHSGILLGMRGTLSRIPRRMPLCTGPVRISTLSESMSFSVLRMPTGGFISSSSLIISTLRPATVQFSRAKTSSMPWVMLSPSTAYTPV